MIEKTYRGVTPMMPPNNDQRWAIREPFYALQRPCEPTGEGPVSLQPVPANPNTHH